MKKTRIHVLIAEDDVAHANAIRRAFEADGSKTVINVVGTLREFRQCSKELPPDIAVMDLNLPDGHAVEALTYPPEAGPFPILLMTSCGNEQVAVTAIKAGALDYVVKSPEAFADMPHTIAHALHEWNLLKERKQAEEALREKEEWFRTVFENASDGLFFLSPSGEIVSVNESFAAMHGYSIAEILKLNLKALDPQEATRFGPERMRRILAGESLTFEVNHRHKQGHLFPLEVTANLVTMGTKKYILASHRDITRRKLAEEALRQSEAALHSVFQSVPVGICIMKNRVFERVNDSWCKGIGYPEKSLLGQSPRMLYESDEEYDRVGRELYAHLQDGRLATTETRLRRCDGAFRDVVMTAALLQAGNPTAGTVVSIHDVTERKRAEEELHLESAALDAAANAIVITNRAGIIQWANPAFTNFTGYAIAEAVGKNPSELVKSGKHEPSFYKNMWDTILGGQVWQGEIINRRKDGSFYTEEMTITPVRDQRGEITHFAAIKQDVTEKKMLESRNNPGVRNLFHGLEFVQQFRRGQIAVHCPAPVAMSGIRSTSMCGRTVYGFTPLTNHVPVNPGCVVVT